MLRQLHGRKYMKILFRSKSDLITGDRPRKIFLSVSVSSHLTTEMNQVIFPNAC